RSMIEMISSYISGFTSACNWLANRFFCLASRTASRFFETYAPRPGFFPLMSTDTSPSLERTTRSISFFGFISPDAKHFLKGIFLFAVITLTPIRFLYHQNQRSLQFLLHYLGSLIVL